MNKNFRMDLLSKLDTSKVVGFNQTVIQKTLSSPSFEAEEAYSL